MYISAKYLMSGDSSITVEFDEVISVESNQKVKALAQGIIDEDFEGLIEVVPTYRSLTIHYDPITITYDEVIKTITNIEKKNGKLKKTDPKVIEIPVCYEAEYALDIEFVAKHNNMDAKEVIKRHTAPDYLIYMIGFTPGFPYLGGMDESISTPRLEKPRIKIDAGSVGIAGSQTGIYPIDSPGGWRIIGKTPLSLYNKDSEDPFLLEMGEYLRFVPIDKDEFDRISKEVSNGSYKIVKHPKGGF